ncbi:zinc finger protein 595-like [Leguminivora glycinivorella]|uniref:zinc finger protein 595-like n=1 Tax=Leguminivora glycinivorella TaxID=1035111 RepID=UPI00200BCEDC|nr:zinc finger protein 595-like [Leguminivora glycinivorella]
MCDIKVEPGDAAVCRGCLSSDRRLSSVDTAVFLPLLTEQTHELDLKQHVALCWECVALLRRTIGFRAQVQRACKILQDSLQLLPTKPTLSSLSVHRNFGYDAVFDGSTPNELPIIYETPSSGMKKYKTQDTRSQIVDVKTIKVVLCDSKNNIKSEHPSGDSDSDSFFNTDDSYSSSQEITETKNYISQIVPNLAVNRLSIRKQTNLDKKPKKGVNKTPTIKKKVAQNRTKVNTAQKHSLKIVKHSSIKDGENNFKMKALESSNIDYKTKAKIKEDEDSDKEHTKGHLHHSETHTKKEKQPEINTNIKLEGDHLYVQKQKQTKTRKCSLKIRKINTKYKYIEEVLPYFQEIEMNEQDLKITLEKDDAIVDKLKIHKCSICGVTFQLLVNLKGHALRNHKKTHPEHFKKTEFLNPPLAQPPRSVWRCAACARLMRREHVLAHMNEFHFHRFLCNSCEWSRKPFWKKEDCRRHWNEVHKQLICDICQIRKKSKQRMEYHIEEAHLPPTPRVCPHCPSTHSGRRALAAHVRLVHRPPAHVPHERRYCPACDRTFNRIAGFQAHFRNKHSGLPKKRFPCPQCDKVLTKMIHLKRHLKSIHAGITEFRCHICSKYLSKKTALRRHLDMHNNVKRPKNHPCDWCGRAFLSNSSLQFHMNTHTGARPYKCTECEAAFTQPYTLRVHLAKQHQICASVGTDGTITLANKTKME